MYINKTRNVYHSLLDLKMGFPIVIKLKNGECVIVCSSETATDESLTWMNNFSNSSLSIILNKHRMEYLFKKSFDNNLYAISFSKKLSSDLCNKLSFSKIDNNFNLMSKAIISFEKRQEIFNIIELMRKDHSIPSVIIGNLRNEVINENNDFKLKNITVIDHSNLTNNSSDNDKLKIISRTELPLLLCKQTEIVSFKSVNEKKELFALIFKNGNDQETPLVRIHSQCITGDLLESLKCDCGSQLKSAIKKMSVNGGIILYMPEEGRNIGFFNKIRAYDFQFHGLDTIDANLALGFYSDQRNYFSASEMLKLLGVKKISLLTNNPDKKSQLEKNGIKIVRSIQLKVDVFDEAKNYLNTKKLRSGHNI